MSNLELDRITHPLRLAQGSHQAGAGHGCSMNLISWIMGEPEITDFPKCSAPPLARMVQFANDMLAEFNLPPFQRAEFAVKYLSPEDSMLALDLAWSTVGTAVTDPDTQAVWASRMISNAMAIVQHVYPPDNHSWDLLCIATTDAHKGDYVTAARAAANAVFIAADMDAMILFVEDAISLWKELNDVVSPDADPAVVNEAIDRMVNA